jgi:hypothetical protein
MNITCCYLDCGVQFTIPLHIYQQACANKERWFYCPNGHKQHFSEDRVAELERKLRLETERADRNLSVRNQLENDVTKLERVIAYWKGQVTRLKNRRRR